MDFRWVLVGVALMVAGWGLWRIRVGVNKSKKGW